MNGLPLAGRAAYSISAEGGDQGLKLGMLQSLGRTPIGKSYEARCWNAATMSLSLACYFERKIS
jgi:hypothetical protein